MTHPSLRAGNVAVITGAGFGGIGYSTAHLLLTTYKLQVLLVDISSSSLAQASAALIAAGAPSESVHTRVVDVSQSAQMFELADFVFSKFGKVDFLMLNAGVQMKTVDYKEGGDLESWNKTLGVNFYGVLHGTQVSRLEDWEVGEGD
jgi:NADP-dependent 3-hydroxy acid dehydrogenase YdfG